MPDATVTSTVSPVPLPPVVAVCVYVPFVYPDPVPVTVNAVTSPKDLTAEELLLVTTFCLIVNFHTSNFPPIVVSPLSVSTLNVSEEPSVIEKS